MRTKAQQAALIEDLVAALKAALPMIDGHLAGSAFVCAAIRRAIAKSE